MKKEILLELSRKWDREVKESASQDSQAIAEGDMRAAGDAGAERGRRDGKKKCSQELKDLIELLG